MADKKITDLPALTTATSADLLPIVDDSGNVTKKVTAAGMADAVVGNTPNNTITAPMFATNAITLGYAQTTSNFSTASTTYVQVTGLTSTVTIPSGGRRVKITVYFSHVYPSGGYTDILISLWDGAVGSGTQLQEARSAIASGNAMAQMTLIACPTPSSGSKTYNVGAKAVTATANLVASATAPAFILVEAI